MATRRLLQWNADFILEHFICVWKDFKKTTQQQQQKSTNKLTKYTPQIYWGTNWLLEWAGLLYWWLWIKQTNCWNKKGHFALCTYMQETEKDIRRHWKIPVNINICYNFITVHLVLAAAQGGPFALYEVKTDGWVNSILATIYCEWRP